MNVHEYTIGTNDDGSTSLVVRHGSGVLFRGCIDLQDPERQVVSCTLWDPSDSHVDTHGVEALRKMVKGLHIGGFGVTAYALFSVLSDILSLLSDNARSEPDPAVAGRL